MLEVTYIGDKGEGVSVRSRGLQRQRPSRTESEVRAVNKGCEARRSTRTSSNKRTATGTRGNVETDSDIDYAKSQRKRRQSTSEEDSTLESD